MFEEAEKHLLKGLEFCERINVKAGRQIAESHLGETYFEMGNFPRSKEHYEKGWGFRAYTTNSSWVGLGKVGLARSRVMNKEKDVDLESLYTHSRNNKVKAAEGWFSKIYRRDSAEY